MDFVLLNGGPCIPNCMPFCGPRSTDRQDHLPYPRQIAGEYDRGFFTLSSILDFQNNERQAHQLGDQVKVGDFISLMLVPQIHTLKDLFVRFYPDTIQYAPIQFTNLRNAAGASVDVEARLYNDKGVLQSTVTLPAAFAGLAMDQPIIQRSAIASGAGYFVPKDQYMEIGLVVKALPSGAGVLFSQLTTAVALVAKVDNYDHQVIM